MTGQGSRDPRDLLRGGSEVGEGAGGARRGAGGCHGYCVECRVVVVSSWVYFRG